LKKVNITTDTIEIHWTTKEYFEDLNSNNLEHIEEMDKFLGIYNLTKLNNELKQINNK
jgi:hypothetical protein